MEDKTVISNESLVKTEADEEYAYLDRGGFSSEKFKIELRGLPKFYGIAELKKLINNKLGLKTSKIKRPKNGSHWLYACFQNDEERSKAIEALNGYVWKGKKLLAEIANPAPDPLVRKRKQEEESPTQQKKNKIVENKSQEERLKDATTPYWNLAYEDQLKLKEKQIKDILMKYDNQVWIIDKNRRKDIESGRKEHNGLSFELASIKKSPVTEGYRNKCEFTVGIDEETKLPTVGFRLGSYVTGTVGVGPIQSMIHISEKMKKAVLLFQEFIRKSKYAPFSPADYSGNWRYLTARESTSNGDVMLIVSMHSENLTESELDEVKKDLVEYFKSHEAVACGIKSLYFQRIVKRRVGDEGSKPEYLSGSTHITDTILGKQFRISPEAFFQVNTAAAEVLYSTAIELSHVTKDSTVLDICCGTGTIGLCFAQHCDKVFGLEMIEQAVQDARANAELNKIENCEFLVGRAEDALAAVLARARALDPQRNLTAILDPPRAGLHMRAITQLRNTTAVKNLVYISCSPASAIKNFVDLSRPSSKTLRGAPFLPVKAVPVDLFPHSKHVELVVMFERQESKETEDIGDKGENINEKPEYLDAITDAVDIEEIDTYDFGADNNDATIDDTNSTSKVDTEETKKDSGDISESANNGVENV